MGRLSNNGGFTEFSDSSTAGNGSFTNNGGTVSGRRRWPNDLPADLGRRFRNSTIFENFVEPLRRMSLRIKHLAGTGNVARRQRKRGTKDEKSL